MKKRLYLISNSSSSSFICEICANTVISMDSPYGMVYCENNHLICEEHLLNDDSIECDDNCSVCTSEHCDDSYSESACPICSFQSYSQPELRQYLIETRGVDPMEVFAEIKKINKRRKKLYDEEYIVHVLKQFELTDDLILDELKTKFGTYKNFLKRNK